MHGKRIISALLALALCFAVTGCGGDVTPAASPFAALMFGNKEWLKSGEVYKYSSMFVVIELVVVLLCSLPLANLLLH